ncbi:LysR family transcriptional regulator [Paraclostridium ghonii]|uniref:LysR family transcriptional regulator n=1 Tax=Paraclostridium ghonii TaxID=29358 RepID=UPI00202CD2A8|nr:LysR family transcriptional regulator [Paeniclostridium ghonii]MCM0166292.1 LysR family transcriptional regulator [Paeniclostridium ghonii]
MELLHLKYFQTVAKTQHMTNAAKKLHIVQPALSRVINSLEKELGVELFDRNGKTISLNENGEMFLETVNETLSVLENGVKKLLDSNNQSTSEIKLLVLAGSNTLPNLILDFKKVYPETTFKLLQNVNGEIDFKDFDFCISSTLDKVINPFSITLLEEELFIGIHNSHPLASKDSIFLEEISNENFISFQSNKPFRTISHSLCQYAGFKPKIVFESDVPYIVRQLIVAGLGISFIPEISWNIHEDDSLKLLKVIDPVCKRYINISWHPDNYMGKYAKEFRDFAVKYYSML